MLWVCWSQMTSCHWSTPPASISTQEFWITTSILCHPDPSNSAWLACEDQRCSSHFFPSTICQSSVVGKKFIKWCTALPHSTGSHMVSLREDCVFFGDQIIKGSAAFCFFGMLALSTQSYARKKSRQPVKKPMQRTWTEPGTQLHSRPGASTCLPAMEWAGLKNRSCNPQPATLTYAPEWEVKLPKARFMSNINDDILLTEE